MPYTHFWHTYVAQHANSGGGWTLNPGDAFAAVLCLFVLACWAGYQAKSRCPDCDHWPVRCRCNHDY
jgi:hypothetical protein